MKKHIFDQAETYFSLFLIHIQWQPFFVTPYQFSLKLICIYNSDSNIRFVYVFDFTLYPSIHFYCLSYKLGWKITLIIDIVTTSIDCRRCQATNNGKQRWIFLNKGRKAKQRSRREDESESMLIFNTILRRLVAWIRSSLLLKIQWWKRHYISEHGRGSVRDL